MARFASELLGLALRIKGKGMGLEFESHGRNDCDLLLLYKCLM